MTFAPPTLIDLAAYYVGNGGVNLGIVGDASHILKGWSYHLGKDDLADGASSARLPRDVAGLTNAASAFDLGKLDGSLRNLQTFSRWLVAEARSNKPGTSDMREIIYSPDGLTVLRWDRERGYASAPRLEGDNSHLTHTHISWYRDAEKRDHIVAFRPYFEDTMDYLQIPNPPSVIFVKLGAKLFDNSAGAGTPIVIGPTGRDMPWVGSGSGWRVVNYVNEAGVVSQKGMYVRPVECGAASPVPPPPLPAPLPPDAVSCKPWVDEAVAARDAKAYVAWKP